MNKNRLEGTPYIFVDRKGENKMTKRSLACFLILVLLLAGCNLLPDADVTPREVSEQSIWAMDTQMDLRLYGDEDGAGMQTLIALLNELNRALSATAADSQLTALNESGWTDDARIVFLTTCAKAYSEQTCGALDITLLPASRCWGFTTGSYGVPCSEDLEALRDRIGMDKITLTDDFVSIPDGTNLDFGALAKGYAADLCREKLEAAGIPAILSLGGSIQTVGTKPDGSAWMIGVQDPDDPGRYALTLQLNGAKAVVTSGDYQRYFMQDSVRYCHILDPKTLSPVRGTLRAVTVVAAEGLRADALSTALFVLGREAGTELWRSQRDFEVIWMEDDGTIWLTSGLKDLASGNDFEVIEP